MTQPVAIANAGDGSPRLFVVEQAGRVRVVKDGSLVNAPFLDMSDRVLDGGEQGLLGVTFHPNYASNGFFYVTYTVLNGDSVTSRFLPSTTTAKADAPLPEATSIGT